MSITKQTQLKKYLLLIDITLYLIHFIQYQHKQKSSQLPSVKNVIFQRSAAVYPTMPLPCLLAEIAQFTTILLVNKSHHRYLLDNSYRYLLNTVYWIRIESK